MKIFSKSKEKKELTLVFDIGSTSVGAALFFLQKSGVPKIICTIREPIFLEKEVDFDRLLSLTAKSLEIVANKILLKKLGAPKDIFCILSSPWYTSQTRTINLEKNTPFIFTAKLADSLTQRELSLFKEEHSIQHSNSGVQLIELKNMKTKLNGYTTSSPLGKKSKELEMTIFISMSSDVVLEKFKHAVGRYFYPSSIKFSSLAMASFVVTRDMFINQKDFLLVDIGGEVTDISLIKNDILCESISFPLGKNFIIRKASSVLKTSLHEAKSLVSLYKDGHANEQTERKLKPVVDELKLEWLKNFQMSLGNLSNNISVPSSIFVMADQDLADFFSGTIKMEQFNQYALTESKFNVVLLDTKTLHGFVVLEKNIIRDPSLIIESIYISSFLR
ncbi:MAG: hypothetical protein WAV23_01580 [Minisyncoccia bacterium]